MFVKQGIAVSPGVAIGPAILIGKNELQIPHRYLTGEVVDFEISRLHGALQHVCEEIAEQEKLATEQLGAQYAAIFGAHLMLARDRKLIQEIEDLIRKRRFAPEQAVQMVLRKRASQLRSLTNSYIAERSIDLEDLEKRLMRHLLGEPHQELANLKSEAIILAHNLTPSETASLDKKFIKAFATEVGGPTSHTAILAGALEIPAVVGLGHFLAELGGGGETVIIDGNEGLIYVDPDEATIGRYRAIEEEAKSRASLLISRRAVDDICTTADGARIIILGNIEFPEEAEHCQERGAEGVGLYRTEFLYLGHQKERSEDDHFQAYKHVARTFGDSPVVIRTLDLGADKIPGTMKEYFSDFANPELGLRSIRVSLANKKLFKTQLRAVMRAAVEGNIWLMFPLVSSLLELRQAKMMVQDVCEDLEEENIYFRKKIPIGMMVEVPSAAVLADEFAREVDFFSIGTNDLIQYTLAADRSDPAVARYYNAADPAILRLIEMVIKAGDEHKIPVTVCGQMCSDPKFVPLLVGAGIRRLSVTPPAILEIRDLISRVTMQQVREIASRARLMESARDIEAYLRGELRKIYQDTDY
jgi:phosphotransferase system enzyme I (PtsI)